MRAPNIYLVREFSKERPVIKPVMDMGRIEGEVMFLERQTEVVPYKCYGQHDIWYVVEGGCSALIDGKQKRIKDGDVLVTTSNKLHGVRNNSRGKVVILSLKVPIS